jgi:crossover junction endodeoxyribonuclease RuvC
MIWSRSDESSRFDRPSRPIVGIDPGITGALVLMSLLGDLLDVADMPCVADGTKGRQTVNAALLAAIFRRWSPSVAFCEFVGARPTDAKVAAFAFGRCRGAIEGTLGALGIPVAMLTVPTWRRTVGLPVGATKEMARGEAIRRFPCHAEWFARVRDDGRAEAALIGVAGLIRQGGGK